jgi:hypothetical protein
MKKLALLLAAALLAAPVRAVESQTFHLTVGLLTDQNGGIMADTKLVQLVAAGTDGVFAAPSSGSLVNGDDILLGQFGLDSSTTSVLGAFDTLLSPALVSASAQQIELRWFPSLTMGSSFPVSGTYYYGEYRDSSGGSAWVLPGFGNSVPSVDLQMLTVSSEAGSLPNSTGRAGFAVSAIPEPSAFALIGGLAVLGLATWRRCARAV